MRIQQKRLTRVAQQNNQRSHLNGSDNQIANVGRAPVRALEHLDQLERLEARVVRDAEHALLKHHGGALSAEASERRERSGRGD